MRYSAIAPAAVVLVAGAALYAQPKRHERAGPVEQGGYLLNTGWVVRPAGRDTPLSTLSMSHSLSPGKTFLAVLNGGYAAPSVSMLDLETGSEVGRTPLGADGWRGLAFSPAGDKLYAGNGGQSYITEFSVTAGMLSGGWRIELFNGEKKGAAHLIADLLYVGRWVLVVDNARFDSVGGRRSAGSLTRRFTPRAIRTPCCLP